MSFDILLTFDDVGPGTTVLLSGWGRVELCINNEWTSRWAEAGEVGGKGSSSGPVTSQQRLIQQQVIMASQTDSINQFKSRFSDTENLPSDEDLLRWINSEVMIKLWFFEPNNYLLYHLNFNTEKYWWIWGQITSYNCMEKQERNWFSSWLETPWGSEKILSRYLEELASKIPEWVVHDKILLQ